MTTITELKTLTVQRKKDGFIGLIGRAVSFMVGGTLLLIGALLFITIIGILPGMGVMMIGVAMMAAGVSNKQAVKCPHCAKAMAIQKDVEDFECARCKQPVIMKWLKV